MMNQGILGSSFETLLNTGMTMAIGSFVAGLCAVIGGCNCATLTARIGKDMRVALYESSLKLSVHEFRQFGTASITTRTVSDITNIQTAFISFMQMVVPVPAICVIALVLSFRLDASFCSSRCSGSAEEELPQDIFRLEILPQSSNTPI
ncbi:ABC transporter transmembrane domain-containing protein [Oscillibacter sp.]|uniref:ABC transporter transmembrane domain-containing protein n=1 Tax=Oscillibacter sp. TaxID=1945593 RepID=UPI002897C889|nr:ABC transporter transmembrane domain-containing protein [Oscillibacter sp.]